MPPVGSDHVSADEPEAPRDDAPRGGTTVVLPVPGHTDAVVVLPMGAGRKPVLVATHGAWDRAEGHCAIWSGIVRGRGFILCPQGRRVDNRVPPAESMYYYPDHHVLDRELVATLDALASHFPDRADTVGAVYAGFSQGAIMGASILPKRPATFPRAILVEGGHNHYGEWSLGSARAFQRGGGKRVFFACGGPWCNQNAQGVSRLLAKAGLEARVGYAEGAGHTMGGGVEKHLEDGFAWVIEGDPRWR
jgi:predicted esterase